MLTVASLACGFIFGLGLLCPGPALETLATLSPRVIAFVVAMAAGILVHDFWQTNRAAPKQQVQDLAAADGG